MRRTHRLPASLIRWTSLCVCLALVFTSFVVTPLAKSKNNSITLTQGQSGSQSNNAKKGKAVTGPPSANLPNLDEAKQRGHEAPRAPQSGASGLRSRRKPLESRQGRKVGDPLPSQKIGRYKTGSGDSLVRNAGAATRMAPLSVRSHHVRITRLRSAVSSLPKQSGHRDSRSFTNDLFFDPISSSRTNYALASNGSVATASSTYAGYSFSPGAAIDGEHKGLNWLNGGGWNDATTQYPDWLEVDFSGSKTIDEIDVYTVQDNYANPTEPTETMTFSTYGNTAFEVQYWTGSAWTDVPSGNVTGNNKVWRKFNFSAITTSKIRVLINDSADHIYSRLTDVEAWGDDGAQPPRTNVALAAPRLPRPQPIMVMASLPAP